VRDCYSARQGEVECRRVGVCREREVDEWNGVCDGAQHDREQGRGTV
jgi:hypothetical protein